MQENNDIIETMFRAEYKKLLLYAKAITYDSPQAEDVVQETFYEALRKIDVLKKHENPQGWLMQTLKNKIQTLNRSQARYLQHFLSLSDEFGICDMQLPRFAEEPESMQTILSIIKGSLEPEEFHIIKRVVIDRASHQQVANELNITVWSSQKRLERIRKKLRKTFPEYRTIGDCGAVSTLALSGNK